MRADTRAVSIDAPPRRIVEFLGDPRNLPRWAVGFAKAIRPTPAGWVVDTGSGSVGVRIECDADRGTVDFWIEAVPGVIALAVSRVIPRGTASEYVFTQFQPSDMTDDVFRKNIQALTHELTVLKALMEVECPL